MSSLTQIEKRLTKIEVVLAKQNAHLEDHLRRTAVVEDELKPVVTHVKWVQGGAKLLALLGVFAGSLIGVLKVFVN